MSVRSMTIILKSEGRLVAMLDLENGGDPVMVGRSPSCALCTPEDDKAVSGKHARLFWKRGNLYLQDANSMNGVFRNNERIGGPVKVKPGCIFSIGSCTLEAEETKRADGASGSRFHQLRFMSGGRKGKRIDIKPDPSSDGGEFTIGSLPGSGLCLNDQNVSRRHAKIIIDGADCWIVDEHSRNGTYVNGEKVGAKKQFLKAGDKISILQYEFEFDPVADGPDLVKMLATLLLLVVLGALYFFAPKPGPAAEDFRKEARAAAEKESFDYAIALVEKARNAKDAGLQPEKNANDALHEDVSNWKATFDRWNEAQSHLSRGAWRDARQALDALKDPRRSWTWNKGGTADAAKKNAYCCHDVMRRYTDALDFIGGLEDMIRKRRDPLASPGSLIRERIAGMDAYLQTTNDVLKCLLPLFNEIRKERDRLAVVLKGVERVDGAIDGISVDSPDFRAVSGVMQEVVKDAAMHPCVVKYAESFLPFCRTFIQTQEFLDNERSMIVEMEFLAVVTNRESIPLPSVDACGKNAKLSDSRAAFLRRHEAYLKEVKTLSPMIDNLTKAGVCDGKKGELLDCVCNPESWKPVFAFDCFGNKKRFPKSSRENPTGGYDRLVGIEYTYENLRALPEPSGKQPRDSMNFDPLCYRAKGVFEHVATFLRYMERSESREFMGGKLGRLKELGAQILADREKLIKMLKDEEGKASADRVKIVAGYYAQYFADNPSYGAMSALADMFKKVWTKMNELDAKIDSEQDPEKRIELRRQLLEVGIPGNEVVRKRWAENLE